MPLQYRHVRPLQWRVKDELYQTCANLCGHHGLTEVANEMFGRARMSTTDSVTFNLDTQDRSLSRLRCNL